MQQSGFFWHVHHKVLLEWCYDYGGREKCILTEKPPHERELRLRLFKPVQGQLPREIVETREARDEAQKAYDEAQSTYYEAEQWNRLKVWKRNARDEAQKAYDEAWKARDEAWSAYSKAERAHKEALSNHKDAIEALHAEECPDCPWDGNTIFPAA